jgi:hypothetical protein
MVTLRPSLGPAKKKGHLGGFPSCLLDVACSAKFQVNDEITCDIVNQRLQPVRVRGHSEAACDLGTEPYI